MSSAPLPSYTRGEASFGDAASVASLPLLPRNLAVGALQVYRATISRMYGDVCRYYPSCSAYALGAVQQHGVLKGSALMAARLARCHPWTVGGIDDVTPHEHFRHQLTPHGFVVPRRKD
ncbi:membrane protein insertion efficiency factor YidD [Microbacterium sp.]|uniref:membrane protein insertion efficiency factor YidD n=1 Tax=Microbacterium sp. TaxID=51671 RepID=UPI003735D231